MSDSSRKFLLSVALTAIVVAALVFFAIYWQQAIVRWVFTQVQVETPPLPQSPKETPPEELPPPTPAEILPPATEPGPSPEPPPPPPEETVRGPAEVIIDVPFTAQAPFANWDDPRQNYGCEEATSLMAMRWVSGQTLDLREALDTIIAISDFEKSTYGEFHDSSSADTLKWIINYYFKYAGAYLEYEITADDIRTELAEGNVVIVPVNGRVLKNPYYTAPGPIQHKILIRGYDDIKKEFITNDPGTRRGNGYRYSYAVLERALMDYETGRDVPIKETRTAMIVIHKPR